MRILAFLVLAVGLVLSPTSRAQDTVRDQGKFTVDPRLCQTLTKHVPDADVAYQPGVDVNGHAVTPADLDDGRPSILPEEIIIPLSVDLMQHLALDPHSLPARAMKRNDIPLGTLTITSGQILFNGKPLSDAQQDNLAVLCMKPH
jgi:hypothetical protein